jgi:hypothetical protein
MLRLFVVDVDPLTHALGVEAIRDLSRNDAQKWRSCAVYMLRLSYPVGVKMIRIAWNWISRHLRWPWRAILNQEFRAMYPYLTQSMFFCKNIYTRCE